MSHASRSAHIADLIEDLTDLYLAQVADLRELAQATEAGEGTLHLEQALRQREIRRADLYRQFELAAFSPVPVVAPNELDLPRGQLMPPSCRRASANLHVPVEQTTPLYKEGAETLRRARRDTDSLKHLQLGLGETGNLPAQGPNEVSW
jgi:hypothetical protein